MGVRTTNVFAFKKVQIYYIQSSDEAVTVWRGGISWNGVAPRTEPSVWVCSPHFVAFNARSCSWAPIGQFTAAAQQGRDARWRRPYRQRCCEVELPTLLALSALLPAVWTICAIYAICTIYFVCTICTICTIYSVCAFSTIRTVCAFITIGGKPLRGNLIKSHIKSKNMC